jgi:hypothetical protein
MGRKKKIRRKKTQEQNQGNPEAVRLELAVAQGR